MGLDGMQHSLQSPLIRAPGRPSGGWRVVVPVNGQNVTVEGGSPVAVYNAVVALLKRNGKTIPPGDIWITLSIQWLSRTPEKYHIVPLSDLLLITAPGKLESPPDPRKRSYKPSDWGHLAWGWLNLFLAREGYHYREFLLQVNYVLDLLNPATNFEIGCAECFREFGMKVEELKKMPETNQAGARKWLVDVHNAVNYKLSKPVLSYKAAAKKAFWV